MRCGTCEGRRPRAVEESAKATVVRCLLCRSLNYADPDCDVADLVSNSDTVSVRSKPQFVVGRVATVTVNLTKLSSRLSSITTVPWAQERHANHQSKKTMVGVSFLNSIFRAN